MANTDTPSGNTTPKIIRFQDENYRLSTEWLGKQAGTKVLGKGNWHSPTLKFISYQQGSLTLLNTCKNQSYKLALQVQENQLLVNCECGHTGSAICEHAYGCLWTIIWRLGERYFEKLKPDGAIALAFAHKNYFDKKETTAGLDVSLRPELKSVFQLAPKVDPIDLPAILKLPSAPAQEETIISEEALGYLLIISFRNKLLPALLPCMGKLNKNRTDIKIFNQFLSGVQKQYSHLLTDTQKELNTACYHLWKVVEKTPGNIIQAKPIKKLDDILAVIFDSWRKILPLLQRQPFVYSYYLYGVGQLKKRPAKSQIGKIVVSELSPSLRFVLADKGAVYQLQMLITGNGKLISGFETGITLFILHQQTIYMLASLRDAAIAEWIHRSGGWITVFKEHFSGFERKILIPLKESYPVEFVSSKKRKNDLL